LIKASLVIKSRITFKQLEAFTFVVDTGTFRAAAAALGTTQPNISARITALENALNVSLLIRDAGSVRLTADGDMVACTWLQGFLRRMRDAYPKLRIQLEVDLSTAIDARLMEGQLDLALHTGPFRSKGFASQDLGNEGYCWVVNTELAPHLAAGPSLAALFDLTILTHAKHTQACAALHRMAAERGLPAERIVHSSALSACVPMVLEGLGAALLPERLVAAEIANGDLHKLTPDWLPDPLLFCARYAPARAARYVGKAALIAQDAARAG